MHELIYEFTLSITVFVVLMALGLRAAPKDSPRSQHSGHRQGGWGWIVPAISAVGGLVSSRNASKRQQASADKATQANIDIASMPTIGRSSTQRGTDESRQNLQELIASFQSTMQDFSREQAISDSYGAVDAAIQGMLASELPDIRTDRTLGGGYNDTTSFLLTNDLASRAAAAGAAVQQSAIVNYGNIASQIGNLALGGVQEQSDLLTTTGEARVPVTADNMGDLGALGEEFAGLNDIVGNSVPSIVNSGAATQSTAQTPASGSTTQNTAQTPGRVDTGSITNPAPQEGGPVTPGVENSGSELAASTDIGALIENLAAIVTGSRAGGAAPVSAQPGDPNFNWDAWGEQDAARRVQNSGRPIGPAGLVNRSRSALGS